MPIHLSLKIALLFLLLFSVAADANMMQMTTGGSVAASCTANITGAGANGNAILTGSATALANLTCQ